MQAQDFRHFLRILKKFDRAMLVTDRDGQLRSRPMAIGDVTDDGRVRFITRDDSAKLDELTDEPKVNVTVQDDMRFLSISGDARATKDRELIDRTWQARQAPWFADGKDDPHVIVLEVVPSVAEYWDRSGTDLVTRILGAGGGSRNAAADAGEHGVVDFSTRPL